MIKATFALLFALIGSSAVGFAAYLQSHPSAFTTLKPHLVSGVRPVSKEVRSVVERVDAERSALTIGEIVIRSELIKPPVAKRAAERTAIANRPCSDWWELGPESHVRMLCL